MLERTTSSNSSGARRERWNELTFTYTSSARFGKRDLPEQAFSEMEGWS